jgi:hypothetical protein
MVKGGLWFSWLVRVRSVLTFLMSLIEPVVPMTACSQNIAQILGANTTAFELPVFKQKIMARVGSKLDIQRSTTKGVAS